MTNILFFILIYLAYLLVWFVINSVVYFVSLAFKKRAIMEGLTAISVVAVYILNFLVGGFLLWWAISIFLSGELLWFLLLIFFGIGLISGLISYLQMPFMFTSVYFSGKIGNLNLEEDAASAEISVRLAKYFLGVYFVGLAYILVFPAEREGLSWWSYVVKPFMQLIFASSFIGLPYIIYHKIRYRSFFPHDKRYFFIQVWRLWLYILIPFGILLLLLSLMTGTL